MIDASQIRQEETVRSKADKIKDELKYVNILRSLLEKLVSTTDIKSIMDAVLNALQELTPSYSISYVISKREKKETSKIIYVSSKGPIGRAYISSVQQDIKQCIDSLSDKVINKKVLTKQLQGKLYSEIIAGSIDEQRSIKPLHSFCAPFRVKSNVLGAFHIASVRQGEKYTEEKIQHARNIIQSAATNFQRIRELILAGKHNITDLIESMNHGVLMFDANKNVTIINTAMTRMTGLSEKDFFIPGFKKFLEEGKIDLEKSLSKVLSHGEEIHIKEIALSRFFYELFIIPIHDHQNKVSGGAIILHDITHLEEASKAQAEFISTASHQLRTPMVGIQWVIERFLKQEKLTKQGKAYLGDIHISLKRLSALVDLLLNVSRIEEGKLGISPQTLELIDFIKGYLAECKPLSAKKNLTVIFENHPKKLDIESDNSTLRNVVQSLVSNAMEYTPKKGTIKVSVEKEKTSFTLRVKDSGIGIPKKEQLHIFEKFFRGSNAQLVKTDGTGLGLHITYEAVRLLGGKIWFESQENKGTTFFVKLPLKSKTIKGEKKLA